MLLCLYGATWQLLSVKDKIFRFKYKERDKIHVGNTEFGEVICFIENNVQR